jgi:YggT family protein
VNAIWRVLYFLLLVYLLLLLTRLVVEWVRVFSRSWRPGGGVAAGLEVVYSATDPPLRLLRRFIPPLSLGTVRLDLGFMVLMIVVYVLMSVTANAASSS